MVIDHKRGQYWQVGTVKEIAMATKKQDIFTKFTSAVSKIIGRPWVFVAALALLVGWGVSGPLVGFSDTWQLVINTTTTIITFLMVFIIQNTQNRDNLAINIKLDKLLSEQGVDSEELLNAEEHSDKRLERDKDREVKRDTKQKNRSRRRS